MISGRSGYSTAYDSTNQRIWFKWDVEYDDIARTVTVTADSNSDTLSRANIVVTLQNGSERIYDLLTLNPNTGGTIINLGPFVFTNVNLKTGTSKGGVGVIDVRDDWAA